MAWCAVAPRSDPLFCVLLCTAVPCRAVVRSTAGGTNLAFLGQRYEVLFPSGNSAPWLHVVLPVGKNTPKVEKTEWAGVLNSITERINVVAEDLTARIGRISSAQAAGQAQIETVVKAVQAQVETALKGSQGGDAPAKAGSTEAPVASSVEAKVDQLAKTMDEQSAKTDEQSAKMTSLEAKVDQLTEVLGRLAVAVDEIGRTNVVSETQTTVQRSIRVPSLAAPQPQAEPAAIVDGGEMFGFGGAF